MNTDAPWPTLDEAEARVLGIQTKLHRWATDDPDRRFDDLFNLVADPAFLVVAWDRVRGNRGARSAGVDGVKPNSIVFGTALLAGLRAQLKARTFSPMPVRERLIPKANGKMRRLGIATARDRVVQATLKLVLEPIFEADFHPCSYGFRPGRRAHDAIAEIRHLASKGYEWVLEGDITACFDEISHTALLQRVRDRIGDKRVVGLVKAFLKAGILSEDGVERDTITGTPQGGILSPLLSNIALSVLDDHFAGRWEKDRVARAKRRRHGLPNYRLVRYADDFVVMVFGTQAHAEATRDEVAAVLAPMGLRLSEAKTRIAHIDKGFDFLGWRIQRHQKRGGTKRYVYTYPAKKALASIVERVRTITRQGTDLSLTVLLHRLNPVLRGWTTYFRPGVSHRTFQYLRAYTWHRVVGWLRRKHPRLNWEQLRRRHLPGWWPTEGEVRLFNPGAVTTTRYRYRGAAIPSPWTSATPGTAA
ncbi:MAG TPA: group II intron reverse transcriptase/maturase [Jiangellaceae bacterium]|nr:group II intron reverse transcriptase/maturase [Jiangellaceae bacterium]